MGPCSLVYVAPIYLASAIGTALVGIFSDGRIYRTGYFQIEHARVFTYQRRWWISRWQGTFFAPPKMIAIISGVFGAKLIVP